MRLYRTCCLGSRHTNCTASSCVYLYGNRETTVNAWADTELNVHMHSHSHMHSHTCTTHAQSDAQLLTCSACLLLKDLPVSPLPPDLALAAKAALACPAASPKLVEVRQSVDMSTISATVLGLSSPKLVELWTAEGSCRAGRFSPVRHKM